MLFDVLADGELHRIGQGGRGIEKEDALDQNFGMLHLIDRLLLDEFAQPAEIPGLAHFGVQEVLVDRRQLFFEGLVEGRDNFRITFHIGVV